MQRNDDSYGAGFESSGALCGEPKGSIEPSVDDLTPIEILQGKWHLSAIWRCGGWLRFSVVNKDSVKFEWSESAGRVSSFFASIRYFLFACKLAIPFLEKILAERKREEAQGREAWPS